MIDLYLEYTKDITSPEVFRKWAAINAIGAAVERRVWSRFGVNYLHPNTFVFMVGPPGSGKSQALRHLTKVLRKSMAVTLAPADVTKQSLLDALAEATKFFTAPGDIAPTEYHYLAWMVSELSNSMSKYDLELAGLLTALFDCEDTNEETRRSVKASGMIMMPGMSLCVGTATKNLGSTISGELWGSGFMARILMVYSPATMVPNVMDDGTGEGDVLNIEIERQLVEGFTRLGDMVGVMAWTVEARTALQNWIMRGCEPVPSHAKMTEYNTRRWMHTAKLAMIAALDDERMLVEVADLARAKEWILEAEAQIPEIFKDIGSHQDADVMTEMLQQFSQAWVVNRKFIPVQHLHRFLSERVAAHSVGRIFDNAINSGLFIRKAGTDGDDAEYIPNMNALSRNLNAVA